jgi:hypothetical protein
MPQCRSRKSDQRVAVRAGDGPVVLVLSVIAGLLALQTRYDPQQVVVVVTNDGVQRDLAVAEVFEGVARSPAQLEASKIVVASDVGDDPRVSRHLRERRRHLAAQYGDVLLGRRRELRRAPRDSACHGGHDQGGAHEATRRLARPAGAHPIWNPVHADPWPLPAMSPVALQVYFEGIVTISWRRRTSEKGVNRCLANDLDLYRDFLAARKKAPPPPDGRKRHASWS